jgi:phosphoribosylformylglycinamidine cyclo-ligase
VKIGMSSDGIGTKIEIAERLRIYDTLGRDLIAMTADDLAANGMETVNKTNILDVDRLDPDTVDALMRGLQEAAAEANIVITGGEIAELGERIGGYGKGMHFNWCAAGIGILPEGLEAVDGRDIRAGDSVIALKSRGFRSNGFSLLRRVMEKGVGKAWHREKYDERSWGEVLLTPSLIYSPLIASLRRSGHVLKGIAHITGGGIAGNLARVLKNSGSGAELTDVHAPLPFMREVQRLGGIPETRAYRLWNMGNGMLIIAEKEAAEDIAAAAGEKGYAARICGRIRAGGGILLQSRGEDAQEIEYSPDNGA